MRESLRGRRIDDLTGYPVDITIRCGCTRVLGASIEGLTSKLGPDATFDDAERRMKCRDCGERGRIAVGVTWGHRVSTNPEPLPDWLRAGLS